MISTQKVLYFVLKINEIQLQLNIYANYLQFLNYAIFYQRFLSSALFIFETSGTFGLLQNKLAKFRRWVVTQKRTETILLRPEAASAPRKKASQ